MLVNNAGILIARPIEELTLEDWDVTMATNLRSLYLMTRAVLPPMRAQGRGDIVNVASLAARNGFVGGTAYTASKHAVLGFSRSLMLELRKENIRVITICPGSVDTGMLRDQPMLKSDPERILRPDDVAESILHTLRLPLRARWSANWTSGPPIRRAAEWPRCIRLDVPLPRGPFAELLPRARAAGWDLEPSCG